VPCTKKTESKDHKKVVYGQVDIQEQKYMLPAQATNTVYLAGLLHSLKRPYQNSHT